MFANHCPKCIEKYIFRKGERTGSKGVFSPLMYT